MKSFDDADKTWHGRPAVMPFNPKASLGQILLWSLERDPKKIGQVRVNSPSLLSSTIGNLLIFRSVTIRERE